MINKEVYTLSVPEFRVSVIRLDGQRIKTQALRVLSCHFAKSPCEAHLPLSSTGVCVDLAQSEAF